MPAVYKSAAGFIMPNLQRCNTLMGVILYNNINMRKTPFIHFLKSWSKKVYKCCKLHSTKYTLIYNVLQMCCKAFLLNIFCFN